MAGLLNLHLIHTDSFRVTTGAIKKATIIMDTLTGLGRSFKTESHLKL